MENIFFFEIIKTVCGPSKTAFIVTTNKQNYAEYSTLI